MAEAEVQCPCCKLFYRDSEARPPRSTALDRRTGLCWDCVDHRGDSEEVAQRRGRQHGSMLRHAYRAAREELAAARREVVEMQRELALRPVRTVVRTENLDQIIVDTARQERDEAYRRRDVAMGALSDARLLHHKRPGDKTRCECGVQYEKCAMADIVDRWTGVLAWERSQAGQAYLDKRHNLREGHPALTDPGYFDAVYRD